jgi:hypothetical protein
MGTLNAAPRRRASTNSQGTNRNERCGFFLMGRGFFLSPLKSPLNGKGDRTQGSADSRDIVRNAIKRTVARSLLVLKEQQ